MDIIAPVSDYLSGSYFTDNEVAGQNTAQKVVGAAPTQIMTLDLGTVAVGDRIMVFCCWTGTKDATAGNLEFKVQKASGTATITWLNDRPYIGNAMYAHATTAYGATICGVINVTVAGTLVIELSGQSAAGNITLPNGYQEMYATFLKKA